MTNRVALTTTQNNIKKWLTHYARPSAIAELYEVFWEYDEEDAPDAVMLWEVYRDLTGDDLHEIMERTAISC